MANTSDLNQLVDYLINGYWEDVGYFAHAFDTTSSNVITYDDTQLGANDQALVRTALESWSIYADLQFKEVKGSGDLTYGTTATSGSVTSASFKTDGETVAAVLNMGTGATGSNGRIGGYDFQIFLHETGHALGLGHPGSYDQSASYAKDAQFVTDSWQVSIMSYFDQVENPNTSADKAVAVTPGMADIMAIIDIYGANTNGPTAGNTTYGVGANTGTYLDDFFAHKDGSPTENSFTIWDETGTDLINFSDDKHDQVVDLNGGAFSSVYGLAGNMGIVPGSRIEKYFAGSGDDYVQGNDRTNIIKLGAGADEVHAANGNDTVKGNPGKDLIFGNAGNDLIDGGTGSDKVHGGVGNDRLIGGDGYDKLWGENHDDFVRGQYGFDDLYGGSGEDVLIGNGGNDTLYGGADDDSLNGGVDGDHLYGDAGNDILLGGDGADSLSGGAGDDVLSGDAGKDSFYFNGGSDEITDFWASQEALYFAADLDSGASARQMVYDHAVVTGGNMVIDFGGGDTLVLNDTINIDLVAANAELY